MSVAPAPVSRLSPCPCGSGKRYKDCHGALLNSPSGTAPAAVAPRSGYRPAGPEWNLLPESERDRLGTLMEAALDHQRGDRAIEAERLYRDVLAVAPQTHDALHMLGMVRWAEGDYTEARRLVEAAQPLRPDYPTIRQNLLLISSAERARDRMAHETLCERALPRLFELLRLDRRPAQAAPVVSAHADAAPVYLIGVDDGSESDDAWMLRRLLALLEPLRPVVWPSRREDAAIACDTAVAPFPAGGVQVWVGVDAEIAPWLEKSDPRRTLVFAQSAPPSRWLAMFRALAVDGARPVELIVDSRAKAGRFGGGHHVLPVPLDVTEFAVAEPRSRSHDSAEFVVGNVAGNGREIRSARAGSLQEHVATSGVRLDVYDPGRFRNNLGAMRNVRCFSRRDSSLAQFLAPLSCYLHYCDTWWEEGLGRDLFGAMALGIPVLCPRASVHAESIEDGVVGFLYDDDTGALEALATLRNDPARRTAMGAAARESARRIFDAQEIALAYRRLVAGA